MNIHVRKKITICLEGFLVCLINLSMNCRSLGLRTRIFEWHQDLFGRAKLLEDLVVWMPNFFFYLVFFFYIYIDHQRLEGTGEIKLVGLMNIIDWSGRLIAEWSKRTIMLPGFHLIYILIRFPAFVNTRGDTRARNGLLWGIELKIGLISRWIRCMQIHTLHTSVMNVSRIRVSLDQELVPSSRSESWAST